MAEAMRPLPIQAVPTRENEDTSRRVPDPGPDEDVDLGRYLDTFARHWVLIVVAALLGASAGFALTRLRPILYEGVTSLVVLPPTKGDTRQTNVASFSALLSNLTLSAEIVAEMGLDKPPLNFTPYTFIERALVIDAPTGTTLIKIKVQLRDPTQAAEASRRLAVKAVDLNQRIGAREGTGVRNQLKVHLDESANRLKLAEAELLEFQRQAQVDLLKSETDAMLHQRGDLLRLLISIESERARLTAAEREISRQEPVLPIRRAPEAEEALRRAAPDEDRRDARSPTTSSDAAARLDLSNPFINPVYQTLDFQIATSRAALAGLERQRRELIEVRKLGGNELPQLSELYRRQIELARRQATHDLAKRVFTDLAVRYEEARTDALTSSSQLQIVDEAIPPERPVSRGGTRAAAFGLVAGVLLAGLVVLYRERRARLHHPVTA